MKEPLVSKILRCALYVVFIVGAAAAVSLPFMFDRYLRLLHGRVVLAAEHRLFLIGFVVGVAAVGLWVLAEMIGMLRSVPQGPFVARNVRALSRCGVLLLVITCMFTVKCFMYFTFLTMACTFLLVICALFSFTLSNLFRRAVAYKEENDLTI